MGGKYTQYLEFTNKLSFKNYVFLYLSAYP